MILFHDKLPCSENFFRYFKNYDKYMEEKGKAGGPARKDSAKSPLSSDSNDDHLKIQTSPKNLQIRSIESPKYGLGLSPIHKFLSTHSPGSVSPGLRPEKKASFNIDTQTQKGMLKVAASTLKSSGGSFGDSLQAKPKEAPIHAYLKDTSPRTLVKNIPLQ